MFVETKRKGDEGLDNPQPKMKRVDSQKKCSDLIVLGLPWRSSEEDVKEYFEQFGDLVLVQVQYLILFRPVEFSMYHVATYGTVGAALL